MKIIRMPTPDSPAEPGVRVDQVTDDLSSPRWKPIAGAPRPLTGRSETPAFPVSVPGETRDGARAQGHWPSPDGRPPLDVTNAADFADFLRVDLGTGPLSSFFLRGDVPVRVARVGEEGYVSPETEHDDGPAQVRSATTALVRSAVQIAFWCYRLVKTRGGEEEPVHTMPPADATAVAIASAPQFTGLRRLDGVTHTPVLRPDGTVLDVPGYDVASRLLYLPDGLVVPPVPAEPSEADMRAARELLLRILAGFPFVSPDDQANFIGALLTPILRPLLPPPYPMLVINAPMMGSGKTLLAEVLRIVHSGVMRSELPTDEDEVRKQITAVLATTTGSVVVFDNAAAVIRSPRLAALLTASNWSDRILGHTRDVNVPNDRLWVTTGNNVALGGDIPRRAFWVTIDADIPQPWMRTDFLIKNLPGYVQDHRAEILRALLVLARAWVVLGQPAMQTRSDGYSVWQAGIAGVLQAGAIDGEFMSPTTNRAETGTDDEDWGNLLAGIDDIFDGPFTVLEVAEACVRSAGYPVVTTALGDLLPPELHEKLLRHANARAITRSMGSWFKNREGRWAAGLAVRKAGKDPHSKVMRWRIERAPNAGSADTAGSVSAST